MINQPKPFKRWEHPNLIHEFQVGCDVFYVLFDLEPRTKISKWFDDHIEHDWGFFSEEGKIIVAFENIDDAILYKLTWE